MSLFMPAGADKHLLLKEQLGVDSPTSAAILDHFQDDPILALKTLKPQAVEEIEEQRRREEEEEARLALERHDNPVGMHRKND